MFLEYLHVPGILLHVWTFVVSAVQWGGQKVYTSIYDTV